MNGFMQSLLARNEALTMTLVVDRAKSVTAACSTSQAHGNIHDGSSKTAYGTTTSSKKNRWATEHHHGRCQPPKRNTLSLPESAPLQQQDQASLPRLPRRRFSLDRADSTSNRSSSGCKPELPQRKPSFDSVTRNSLDVSSHRMERSARCHSKCAGADHAKGKPHLPANFYFHSEVAEMRNDDPPLQTTTDCETKTRTMALSANDRSSQHYFWNECNSPETRLQKEDSPGLLDAYTRETNQGGVAANAQLQDKLSPFSNMNKVVGIDSPGDSLLSLTRCGHPSRDTVLNNIGHMLKSTATLLEELGFQKLDECEGANNSCFSKSSDSESVSSSKSSNSNVFSPEPSSCSNSYSSHWSSGSISMSSVLSYASDCASFASSSSFCTSTSL